MKVIQENFAKFSRFQISLGLEKRIYFLSVVETDEMNHFFLLDYYGWPVTDFNLIREATEKFNQFKSEIEGQTKMGIHLL